MADVQQPLVILRYPGVRDDSYVVLKPSARDADVYELASSWFANVEQAKGELQRMRERGQRSE